jgi:hypothetical protein
MIGQGRLRRRAQSSYQERLGLKFWRRASITSAVRKREAAQGMDRKNRFQGENAL